MLMEMSGKVGVLRFDTEASPLKVAIVNPSTRPHGPRMFIRKGRVARTLPGRRGIACGAHSWRVTESRGNGLPWTYPDSSHIIRRRLVI